MNARVFISYRSSDGADKATALARDLDALFGDAQIFLDKDDLPAGLPWREEIAKEMQTRPILLVLVTPHYLGAVDANGARRIDEADDPARLELADALAANALVVPLMCDGVSATPAASELPAPFDQLVERTWRHLRAYDWREDLGRLAADLEAMGLQRCPSGSGAHEGHGGSTGFGGSSEAAPMASTPRRVAMFAGLAVIGSAAVGLWIYKSPPKARTLTGRWRSRIAARGATTVRTAEAVLFNIDQQGPNLRVWSGPVDIGNDPDWQNHRDYWKQRTGNELRHVVYSGDGRMLSEAGEPLDPHGNRQADATALHRVAVTLRILVPGAESEPIDSGTFRGTVDEQDRRISGRLWLNSEHAERVVELRRDSTP